MEQYRCTYCGQTDDHPKVHVDPDTATEATYHYDCLPFDLRAADGYVDNAAKLAASGVHGNELRTALTAVDRSASTDKPKAN